jgi:hypothetical protein
VTLPAEVWNALVTELKPFGGEHWPGLALAGWIEAKLKGVALGPEVAQPKLDHG